MQAAAVGRGAADEEEAAASRSITNEDVPFLSSVPSSAVHDSDLIAGGQWQEDLRRLLSRRRHRSADSVGSSKQRGGRTRNNGPGNSRGSGSC